MIKNLIKFPKNLPDKKIEKFFLKKKLSGVIKLYKGKYMWQVGDMRLSQPYHLEPRDWRNLYRLFQFVVINKRTTILEFGSGWSSLILYSALNENKKKYLNYVKNNLRRNNIFELFVLENEKKFMNISKKRIVGKTIKSNRKAYVWLLMKGNRYAPGVLVSAYSVKRNIQKQTLYVW